MALDRNEADRVSDIERLPRRPDADAGSVGDNLEVQRADAALVQHFNADGPHRSRLGVRKLDCCPLRQRRRHPTYAMALDVRRHFLGHARLLVFVWIWLACSFGGTSASVSGGNRLGNHHPPRLSTGVPLPLVVTRWRCQHLHSGVFSRMKTCSGTRTAATAGARIGAAGCPRRIIAKWVAA